MGGEEEECVSTPKRGSGAVGQGRRSFSVNDLAGVAQAGEEHDGRQSGEQTGAAGGAG